MDRIARRLSISGRVQGVGYRAWLHGEAERSGLSGWVRNRKDGRVEALLVGDEAHVDALVARAGKGPPMARVDAVELSQALGIVADGFRILPTV